MSLTNFVPSIWSRELNIALRKELVGMSVTNQDYQGEIQELGDTVKITRPAGISTGSYTPGSDITVETPTSSTLDLAIDQADYFAFEVDDVRQVQANVDLIGPYTEEANYAMADAMDQYVMSLYTEADASNTMASVALTASNIYSTLTEAKKLLSQNNVPKTGRFVVLSPEEVQLLEDSSEFTSASDLGDETKATGFAGRVAGFEVYESNNLVETTGTPDERHIIFGHPIAITLAVQVSQVESQRMEKRFSDLVKGLGLYGAKVIKPKALGTIPNDIS